MKSIREIKILLISPLPPPVGGIATWTLNLREFFSEQNITNVEHLNSAINFRSVISKNIIIRIIPGILNFISSFFKFVFRLIFFKPDVIHLTSSASLGLFSNYLFLTATRLGRIPVVIHWRFGRIPALSCQQNWEWRMLCSIVRKSNKSIVIDKESFKALTNAGFTNVVNIPNPISLDVEKKVNELINPHLVKQAGRVIFVGHVIQSKGIYELVYACMQSTVINELIVIGPYKTSTKKELFEIANQRDNGVWLTIIDNLNKNQILEEMSKSCILALPSYTEGFPNVVIEGMSMGCAIVATNVGAIPETIANSSDISCGICVPVKDIETLRNTIEYLINNQSLAVKMGEQGKLKVIDNYTLRIIVPQYQKVWNQAIKK